MGGSERIPRRLPICLAAVLFLTACASPRVGLRSAPEPYLIKNPDVTEASGIVKSRQFENVFWIHNDSGDSPRIFAINRQAETLAEVRIQSATHVDWEDLAQDNAGNLYIGDIGNNLSKRKDLGVYVIQEPAVIGNQAIKASRFLPFRYPDQQEFGSSLNMNFDAEALFYYQDTLWLLTRNWTNTRTKLYRFPTLSSEKEIVLEKVDEFDMDGMVTAADIHPSGEYLAVLTYDAIWLFRVPQNSNSLLSGKRKKMPIYLKQCEGICWDGEELLVVNEQGEVYRINPKIGD